MTWALVVVVGATALQVPAHRVLRRTRRCAEAPVPAIAATAAAAAFGAGLYAQDAQKGLEFAAGYIIEQSLSVDNLLVFLLIFDTFEISDTSTALKYGLVGAVIFRGIFVVLGAAAIESFRPVLLVFAVILIYAAISDKPPLNLKIPFQDGDGLWQNGPTRLLAAIICLELSDIVFAIDSVPAVFAISKDPYIVYSSNIFAIIGLRAWFTFLKDAMTPSLEKAVKLLLGFVGVKIGLSFVGVDISTTDSLAFILLTLGGAALASLVDQPTD